MRTRQEYDQAISILRTAVARWDPFGLLGGGAPADEWDAEIALLLPKIQKANTAVEIARQLAAVLGERLGDTLLSSEECNTVAVEIYLRLKTDGLLDA
jgi:hypothetical protein